MGAGGWVRWAGESQGDVVVAEFCTVHVNSSNNSNLIFWVMLSVIYPVQCLFELTVMRPLPCLPYKISSPDGVGQMK